MFGDRDVYLQNGRTYPRVLVGYNPKTKRSVYTRVHRAVMDSHLEKTRGYGLQPGEIVHHKDRDPMNWELSNLELWETNHPSGSRIADVRNDLQAMRNRVTVLETENKRLTLTLLKFQGGPVISDGSHPPTTKNKWPSLPDPSSLAETWEFEENFLEFPEPIVAVGVAGELLTVLTENRLFSVDPSAFLEFPDAS